VTRIVAADRASSRPVPVEVPTVPHAAPPPTARLPLRDELFLLGHDDDDGRCRLHPPVLSVGLAGATLIELFLAGALRLHTDRIVVHARDPVGDPITDAALTALLQTRGAAVLRPWLRWFADDLYERTRAGLVAAGVLHHTTHRRFGLLPVSSYRPVDTTWVIRIRGYLRSVLYGHRQPDNQCAALCGLAAVLGLGGFLYIDAATEHIRAGLHEIARGHYPDVRAITAAVDEAVGDITVAVYR
jgi:hypothetical protein